MDGGRVGGGMSGWRDEWVEGLDMCYSYDVNICTQQMANEAFISCEE